MKRRLRLCSKEDGLVKLVKEELHAVLIRVPQEIYKPLAVLVMDPDGNIIPPIRGNFANYLTAKDDFELRSEDLTPTRVANISGKETIAFDTDLGLKILDGYLKGFLGGLGVSVPSFTFEINSSKTMSYTFEEVYRIALDHGMLGDHLMIHQLNVDSPAVSQFLGENANQMLLIDQTFVSKEFNITFQTEKQGKLELELDALVDAVGSISEHLEVSRKSSSTVSFKGDNPLPFAFSCIKLVIDDKGNVKDIPQVPLDMLHANRKDEAGEVEFQHFLEDEGDMLDLSI
ncbi:MAG: hypothetical protein MRZ79_03270 [Bacteroidia bacterium]|nr:hypothetical protein [Bacteroidia bacterium]